MAYMSTFVVRYCLTGGGTVQFRRERMKRKTAALVHNLCYVRGEPLREGSVGSAKVTRHIMCGRCHLISLRILSTENRISSGAGMHRAEAAHILGVGVDLCQLAKKPKLHRLKGVGQVEQLFGTKLSFFLYLILYHFIH